MTAALDGVVRDGRHHMQIRVYYEDTDFSGIVYHANYLRFMERGRTNHLRLMGAAQHTLFAEAELETPGFAFVVRSMQIDFFKPARMDDVLDVVGRGEGRLDHAGAGGAARRRHAGESAGACRLHQRGAGTADPEGAADVAEGRSGLAIQVWRSSDRQLAIGPSESGDAICAAQPGTPRAQTTRRSGEIS
jgi:hypothetical protein